MSICCGLAFEGLQVKCCSLHSSIRATARPFKLGLQRTAQKEYTTWSSSRHSKSSMQSILAVVTLHINMSHMFSHVRLTWAVIVNVV